MKMRIPKKTVSILIAFLLLPFLLDAITIQILPVFAGFPPRFFPGPGKGAATIYVSPQDSLFKSPPTANGTWFTINVRIANATFVGSYQIELTYDKSLLSTTDANVSKAPDYIFPGISFSISVQDYNATHNLVLVTDATSGLKEYNATDKGLIRVSFQITKLPSKNQALSSMLYMQHLSELAVFGTWTIDTNAKDNDLTLKDGNYEIVNAIPVALFSWTPTSPRAYQLVTFDASASKDLDGTIVNYAWNFGDNTTTSNKIVYHTYSVEGNYNVTLKVTDNDGLTDTTWHVVTVFPKKTPAAIYVDPPKKIDPMLVPSTNFTIDVNIKNATLLRRFGLKLVYNSTLLNVVKAELGSFLPPATIYTIEINNTEGYVGYSARVDPPEPALNGNGMLAHITFHVKSFGLCNLTLTETSLIDDLGDPLPHSTKDGYFNNMLLAKIAVQPPEIRNSSLLPPQTFEVNITIAEVEDLYGYAFKLGYDPAIIIALQVTIHEVFGEVNYIPNFSVDNTRGIVEVSVTYFEPANPISTIPPITVVTLKFRVRARGITALDLYDTNLTDSAGYSIIHESYDGFFANVRRDIALINIVRDQTEAYKGWIVNINVTARNEGDLNETFNVKLYYGINGSIGILTFTNVDPNETVTQTFPWNTGNVPACQNYTIWGEAVALPYETDLADNFFTDGTVKIWLMGDLNHDRKVDGRDIAVAAGAFASYPGHPRWDPLADLNQDNKIDGRDIAIIARNFAQRC